MALFLQNIGVGRTIHRRCFFLCIAVLFPALGVKNSLLPSTIFRSKTLNVCFRSLNVCFRSLNVRFRSLNGKSIRGRILFPWGSRNFFRPGRRKAIPWPDPEQVLLPVATWPDGYRNRARGKPGWFAPRPLLIRCYFSGCLKPLPATSW